jgi:(1->4)-alpha-D-glucan 1-alpha-D-glucosylmutase
MDLLPLWCQKRKRGRVQGFPDPRLFILIWIERDMKIPAATYRLQFNPSFGFKEAREIIVYLSELGISSIYASPIFKARKGSLHSYDVVNPNELNPELGSVEDFRELIEELKDHDMSWVQDIVPNHMGYDSQNEILMDVLENGKTSSYLKFFDIEWDHPYESMNGRLLAPFLGRLYGESLEDGEIQVKYEENGFTVNYYDLKFPIKIESYLNVITYRLNTLEKRLGEDHSDFIKLLGIFYSLKNLPAPKEDAIERYNQIRFIKRMLWELYTRNRDIRRFIDGNIKIFNGERGNPESFSLIDSLLSEQNFRLSFWKVAAEEINYRRFFNINELISLKVEEEDVFNHSHSLIFKMVEEGQFTGLRIDHIDGLNDPTSYLKRLKDKVGDTYIVVEKILDIKEDLPNFWVIQGTTGYEFLNNVNGIFCDMKNEKEFSKIYLGFTGLAISYEDLVAERKRLIIGKHMAGDIDNLAHMMKRISGRHRHGSDITLYGLRRALVEVMALFPVYRTYINQDVFSERDKSYIKEAVKKAMQTNPGLLNELDFIEQFLLVKFGEYLSEDAKRECIDFIMRFQQYTGPLMAKGFEDTTLYVYNRLLSLNDVGGDPYRFGIAPREFHDFNKNRVKLWPNTMNTTSTHDTKRGEDVRARINVLSEIPEEWKAKIKKWSRLNRGKKKIINHKSIPDMNDEYFLYQTLIGALPFYEEDYPIFIGRLKDYIIKAIREAKVHTAWIKPDTDYEQAFISFIDEILKPSEQNQFLKEFLPFQKRVAYYGIFNSLSQTLLKITSPGVADLYQGTELWDLNLVDPDNRRPVDFENRKRFLRKIKEKGKKDILNLINELISTKKDGIIKLFLIYKALNARAKRKELFEKGDYISIQVGGKYKGHIVAFARRKEKSWAITIVSRLLTYLIKENEYPIDERIWEDTHILIPKGANYLWRDAFTNQIIKCEKTLSIAKVLTHFPVALLISEEKESKQQGSSTLLLRDTKH